MQYLAYTLNEKHLLCSEFQKIYKRLDITVTERGESFYQPMMPDMVKGLEAKGQNNCTKLCCNSYYAHSPQILRATPE